MALPDALDHLDLAWRLAVGEHLVRVPRAAMAAKLTQPVGSVEEFESRCSALADLLNAFNLPKPATLHNMKVKLGEILGDEAGRAQAAVDTLRSVVALRAGQQHQGADRRAEQARVALGLAPLTGDRQGSWNRLRLVTIRALDTISRRDQQPDARRREVARPEQRHAAEKIIRVHAHDSFCRLAANLWRFAKWSCTSNTPSSSAHSRRYGVTPKSVGMQTQPYLNGCSVAGSVMRSSPDCERTLILEIGRVLAALTMREGTIQAWQQDWARRLAHSARQRWKQLAWDQLPGSYLNESWSFVR